MYGRRRDPYDALDPLLATTYMPTPTHISDYERDLVFGRSGQGRTQYGHGMAGAPLLDDDQEDYEEMEDLWNIGGPCLTKEPFQTGEEDGEEREDEDSELAEPCGITTVFQEGYDPDLDLQEEDAEYGDDPECMAEEDDTQDEDEFSEYEEGPDYSAALIDSTWMLLTQYIPALQTCHTGRYHSNDLHLAMVITRVRHHGHSLDIDAAMEVVNRANVGGEVVTGSVADMRGAVLNSGSLPLRSFMYGRL
ncbi:hypothetical protein BV25DRAFT_1837978 [Artomyces pyxidatus]|uniref:Uncharacterized protein n=1 Tax=Artomyces pyxidatus TaxID=48021 RepID=A0ACB8T2B6_9AGAM|nr:hypothetical protein BV25DRAFT_1837978 [Artomyces pyxidatus]